MSKTIGWGLIGTSNWAEHTFGPALIAASNAKLHAVLSSRQQNAEAFCEKYQIDRGYSNLDAFLADDNVEAIWITSPTHLHTQHAIAALQAGKHVLCEKPMAVNVADCQAMVNAAEHMGKLLTIGYMMRHHPMHQKLHTDWLIGKFGTPVMVRAQFYSAYSKPPNSWLQKLEISGGWAINAIGTHLIDLLRWFLGDVTDVYGRLSNHRFGLETDDHALVIVHSSNDSVGVADASTGTGGPDSRLEIYGTEGYCICEGTFFGKGGTVSCSHLGGSPEVFNVAPVNVYQRQVEAFSRAIAGEQSLLVTPRDGLENVRIISQVRNY